MTQHKTHRSHGWLLALLLLLFGGVAEYLARQEEQRADSQLWRHTTEKAAQLRATLETELNRPLLLSQSVVAHIKAGNGEAGASEFKILLPNLVRQGRFIRNMGVAPGNRLLYLYPEAGNEAAIGLYYPALPDQWPDIEHSIRQRQPFLTGPLELTQGGRGLIYRIPVFLSDERYWGMVSTVLQIDEIWQQLQQQAVALDSAVALRRHDGQQAGPWLFGELATEAHHAVLLELSLAGSSWQLAVWPAGDLVSQAMWLRVGGYTVALVLCLLLAALLRANQRWIAAGDVIRHSETYYRTVLDNVGDAIIVLNADGQIRTFNKEAVRLFGYEAAQLRGLPYQILFTQPPELSVATTGELRQPTPAVELSALKNNGEAVLCELLQSRVELQQEPLHLLLFRDISERKRIERLKNEFVSTVSHELRTPLTAINGALSLLSGGAVGSFSTPQQQMLDVAKANADQLMTLVNDILDFEKLQAGKLALQSAPTVLLPLLQQALQRHRGLAEAKRLHLKLEAAIAPELTLWLDGARLQQILGNLLTNAIRFSPPATVVRLSAELDGDLLRLTVSDQGQGVPATFLPRLFQKFAQADASDSRAQGGSGLGLAICRELAEQMQGRIDYQPAPGGGACFYCEFPLDALALPAGREVV